MYKNSKSRNVFYISENGEQNYIYARKNELANIQLKGIGKLHKLQFFDRKISYFSIDKKTYFEGDEIKGSLCKKEVIYNAYQFLDDRSIVRAINAEKISKLADETCNAEQKEKIGHYLEETLTNEKNWLLQCYNNESIKKLIDEDTNYLNYAGNFYSKFLQLIQKINSDEKPLTISCKMSDATKLGSYNESSSPPNISFNWENFSAKTNEADLNENLKRTLGHELLHYGQQIQDSSDEAYNSCINESYAKIFTEFCSQAAIEKDALNNDIKTSENQKSIPRSEEIALKCRKAKNKLDSSANSKKSELVAISGTVQKRENSSGGTLAESSDGVVTDEAYRAIEKNNANTAIQTNLQQTVTANDFTQISDSTFTRLASAVAPNVRENESYTVSANSDFGRTVESTMNSFSNSGKTLTAKLNAAVAATTTKAIAATPTTPTSRTVASTNSDSNSTTTRERTATSNSTLEKSSAANSGKTPSSNSESNPNSDANSVAVSTANSTTTATTKTTTDNQVTAVKADGAVTTATPTNTTAVTAKTTGSAATSTTSRQPNGNTRSVASVPHGTTLQNSDTIVSSMRTYTEVKGNPYVRLKNQYYNPSEKSALEDQLIKNKVRISFKDSNGRTLPAIGFTGETKYVFTDDGTKLKSLVKVDQKN